MASSDHYSDDFYEGQIAGSLRSAIKYVDFLSTIYLPVSVADLGCGRGTWLKAFKDRGAGKVVGYDGPWNQQSNMVDQAIEFHSVDLNKPIDAENSERFDLAMSLEVAEHLEASSASGFVSSLTRLSDVVLFSAAFTQQGGTNHINEQPHTYWAKIFALHDYVPYDLFRPLFWGDEEVEFWYQQNVFTLRQKRLSCCRPSLQRRISAHAEPTIHGLCSSGRLRLENPGSEHQGSRQAADDQHHPAAAKAFGPENQKSVELMQFARPSAKI